ncbi:MAG: dCTP deaminase [Kiritimatiellae bacterium]|nr:dCTP deaminase [Kiritimatiellia bacterium]MDD5522475.1 dCTP deaminase [Kiritimatiellia bacterium]
MAVLNNSDIKKRIEETNYTKKLIITPLLSEGQIGTASVDIRLGSSIIIPKKVYLEKQDVTDEEMVLQVEKRRYDKVKLQYHSQFMLHPNQLILSGTFEYICLPDDLFSTVMSRSSWGRLGLVVATASAIQPGYKGCLTLELVNVSESPIALYPGLSIGQLVFHEVIGKGALSSYEGRYDCPTEAELPKFFHSQEDYELTFWGSKKPSRI